jgi:purine-binding chemotaxis protein CheW
VPTTTDSYRPEAATREFLSFRLGDAEYGIDILKVQEIRGCDRVSRIANTPAFMKGVIDPARDHRSDHRHALEIPARARRL